MPTREMRPKRGGISEIVIARERDSIQKRPSSCAISIIEAVSRELMILYHFRQSDEGKQTKTKVIMMVVSEVEQDPSLSEWNEMEGETE